MRQQYADDRPVAFIIWGRVTFTRAGAGEVPLSRRVVRAGTTFYIGKESDLVEEVEMGLWHRLEEVATTYAESLDPGSTSSFRFFRRCPPAA
jgi:hypothetical protein